MSRQDNTKKGPNKQVKSFYLLALHRNCRDSVNFDLGTNLLASLSLASRYTQDTRYYLEYILLILDIRVIIF